MENNIDLNNEFALLTQFFEDVFDVSGRGARTLTPEEEKMLEKFASGNLSAKERKALIPALLESDQGINDLVKAIKSRQQ